MILGITLATFGKGSSAMAVEPPESPSISAPHAKAEGAGAASTLPRTRSAKSSASSALNQRIALLAKELDGYSGADIKYICDRAATVPFLRSVATGVEGQITADVFQDTVKDTGRSVTSETLKRFEAWESEPSRD